MLTVQDAVKKVREVLMADERVLVAYLFGSTAKGLRQPISDIDVAVLVEGDGLRVQAELLALLAKALKVPEEKVDIVDLRRAPIHLKHRVLSEGIMLIDRGPGEQLLREVIERYPEANESLQRALRSWPPEDPHIDPAIIQKRVDEVLRIAALIRERYSPRSLDDILSDPEKTLALERALERLTEAMADTCRHVVSAKRLGLIDTQAEYPLRIAEQGQMDRELSEKIAELIRLRNILAHTYLDVDYSRLFDLAREAAEEVAPRFVKWAKDLLT
jgi:uncharacterized protein YutE (UPF0331/DUF86 family)/predicted nucleotidyltransferase